MSVLEGLRAEVDTLRDQLRAKEHQLRQAEIDACPVKVGDIVRHKRDGRYHRVVEINPKGWGGVWIVGNPKRADGSFGTARRNLYDNWEVAS